MFNLTKKDSLELLKQEEPQYPLLPLRDVVVFPGMVVQMVAVGEQTGALDAMLSKIADFYDDEVDAAVSAMTSLLEPLMMVILGGSIGALLIAMYLPIFKIAETIG